MLSAPILPFCLVLLLVALMPQWLPHQWEQSWIRGAALGAVSLPALYALPTPQLMHALFDYVAFMALIAALFVIAGGIVIEGFLGGTPWRNTVFLAVGTALASLIGTTGAAMLLVRPYLRANVHRRSRTHQLVFFIILVGNLGGLLLPMGDPPLFMGYLRGVPFFWTLGLWPMWLCCSTMLLALFFVLDTRLSRREPLPPIAASAIGIRGRGNVVLLAAVVLWLLSAGRVGLSALVQAAGLLVACGLSYLTTPKSVHRINQLTAAPLLEVGSVFLAIFVTLPAASGQLRDLATALPTLGADAFFWLTGAASSVLDNAPCYLAMANMAQAQLGIKDASLHSLVGHPHGQVLLRAISEGAVSMGALTYIGNGPNLLVRSLAIQRGVEAPSFLAYIAYAAAALLPVLAVGRWLTH